MWSCKRAVGLLNGMFTTWMSAALLICAISLFIAAQVPIHLVNGWWSDELFSLWSSDVSVPFTTAFNERMFPDSNPPLYLGVLYWARWFIADDRTAVLTVNIAAIAIAAGVVFFASLPAGLGRVAAGGIAAFLLSGPVLFFASEGRSYCLVTAIVFVAAWYAALAIQEPHHRPALGCFIGLGAVAALTHVYAALFCGGLGAGLLILALFSRRRDLIGPGFAVGLSACVVFVIWLSMNYSSAIGKIGWIEFSPKAVFEAVRYAKRIAVGWNLTALLLVPLLAFGLFDRATRSLFIAFGVAFALFVSLPIIASFKWPMIWGPHWLVGAPALITLVVFAAFAWFSEFSSFPAQRRMRLIAACGALLFLGASDIHGLATTSSYVAEKPIWRGAKIVRSLLDRCPAGAVHVATDLRYQSLFFSGFSKLTGASPSLFVDARLQSTPIISPGTVSCPVLGWAESIWKEDLINRATDRGPS